MKFDITWFKKDDIDGMVAAPFTSQDLSPSPSFLQEFKEYQEYKEYQEFRGYTPPHLGVSSLKEQQVEETKKKVINGFISFKKIIINKKKITKNSNCQITVDTPLTFQTLLNQEKFIV